MPTDSFTSTAAAIGTATGTFMSVDSFTSTAAAVSAAPATFTNAVVGSSVLTRTGFFQVRVTPAGVTLSKASSFGGAQGSLVAAMPLKKNDARELAEAILGLAE